MNTAERRLHDAKLGAAIDNASAKLPDGYSLVIEIGSGYWSVGVSEHEGFTLVSNEDGMTLDDAVNDAVRFAVYDARYRG